MAGREGVITRSPSKVLEDLRRLPEQGSGALLSHEHEVPEIFPPVGGGLDSE